MSECCGNCGASEFVTMCARCKAREADVVLTLRLAASATWNRVPLCASCRAEAVADSRLVALAVLTGDGQRPGRTFPARYAGKCSACGQKFQAGAEITGRKGKWQHASCPPPLRVVESPGGAA